MNPSDLLKQARGSGYGSGPTNDRRSFPLTPEEIEAIGENATCVKAYGSHKDGTFAVDRVEPDSAPSQDGEMMVKTPTNISPS